MKDGTVFKVGNVYYGSFKNASGKWVKKSTRRTIEKAALLVLAQWQKQARAGTLATGNLEEFLAARLERQKRSVSAGSWTRYSYALQALMAEGSPLRGLEVAEVEARHLSSYIDYRLGQGVKKPTALKEMVWLKSQLTEARRQKLITSETVQEIRDDITPKALACLKGANKARSRVLSPQEMQALLAEASKVVPGAREVNNNLKDALGVALLTGLRQGNLLELRAGQIDFTSRPAVIRYAAEDMKNEEPHLVRLHPIAAEILARRCNGEAGRRVFHDFRPSWKRLQKRLAKTGLLEGFRFHDLRRTYTSYRLAAGAPPKQVQRELGHGDSRMTMDVYGRALDDPGAREYARRYFRFDLEAEAEKAQDVGPGFSEFFPGEIAALVNGGG